jgi:hypothetical protein
MNRGGRKGGEGMNGGGPSRSPGYPPGRERGAERRRRSDPVPAAVRALPTPVRGATHALSTGRVA